MRRFLGRAAIHPKQLPVIADAFRPSTADVVRARELLAAAETADSGAVLTADGRFVDEAVLRRAAAPWPWRTERRGAQLAHVRVG